MAHSSQPPGYRAARINLSINCGLQATCGRQGGSVRVGAGVYGRSFYV